MNDDWDRRVEALVERYGHACHAVGDPLVDRWHRLVCGDCSAGRASGSDLQHPLDYTCRVQLEAESEANP